MNVTENTRCVWLLCTNEQTAWDWSAGSSSCSVNVLCSLRAWVPINNCYLMSKEIPFSVKKTKSIFNSAMQEMEVYVENIRKKFGVFNYAPFRTPYTANNQLQMLLDPCNPAAGTVKTEKPDKLCFSFDMTTSPKMVLGKSSTPGGMSRRVSVTDMPRSPMSTNSSIHTGSDGEQDPEKPGRNPALHYSTGEESMDCTGEKMLLISCRFRSFFQSVWD